MCMLSVEGFHGTSLNDAKAILENGFVDSNEKGSWFGRGIYFFESYGKLCDGKKEAYQWATNIKRHTDVGVVKATINSCSYIDMVENEEHRVLYRHFVNEAEKHLQRLNQKRIDETKIFGILFGKAEIDFIRVLTSGHQASTKGLVYANARPQIQICVKKHGCMSNLQLV